MCRTRTHYLRIPSTGLLLPCCAGLLFFVSPGCATPRANEVGFRSFRAEFNGVTGDGEVLFRGHKPVRLAGIRMRPASDTEEPELLMVINKIVKHLSDDVRVDLHLATNTAVIHYKQSVHFLPAYGAVNPRRLWRPQSEWKSINELLIVMAAARYDPGLGSMTDAASSACQLAQQLADEALWEKYRDRPLADYSPGDAGQLYTDKHGWRARIARGDVELRDRNLAAAAKAIAEYELATTGMMQYTDAAATETATVWLRALHDANRIVRRHAVTAIRELPSIPTDAVEALRTALEDEDRFVRELAKDALIACGS